MSDTLKREKPEKLNIEWRRGERIGNHIATAIPILFNGVPIATISSLRDEEMEGFFADLISEAPQLLNHLVDCVEMIGDFHDFLTRTGGNPTLAAEMGALLDRAQTSIDKALAVANDMAIVPGNTTIN